MNFTEIQERREIIAKGPIFRIPETTMAGVVARLKAATPGSKKQFDAARQVIPGGYQHMLVNKNPYPLTIQRARGVDVWDVDGNGYTDFLMMAGPIILGHNYPPLMEKMAEVLQTEGTGMGWTSQWEVRAAEQIVRHIRSVEQVRFFQSGTEADMAAARLARAFTGRNKILRVGGSYHGWSAEFVYDMQIPYSGPFQASGIPAEFFSHIVSIGPNDVDGLEKAFADHEGDIAAVIVEPNGGESGALPVRPDFNKVVREICDRCGALLIFDEVVTGFRLAMGGAQEYYGVDADLTVLGKVLTHGFPSSGALGGKKEIMDCVAGMAPGKPKPFVAGTLAANAISTSAAYWAIHFIEEEKAIDKANAAGARLTRGLNDLFDSMDFPFFAYDYGSIVHYETAGPLTMDIRQPGAIESALARKQAVDDFSVALLAEGLITKYGNRAFLCMAHTDETIDKALQGFENALKLIEKP